MNIQSLDFWESTFVLLHLTRKPHLVSFLSIFLFQNFFYPFSVPAAGIHLLSNGQGLRVWAIKTSSSKCMYFGHGLTVLTWGQCSLEPPSILVLSLANQHHSRGTSPTVLWLRKGVKVLRSCWLGLSYELNEKSAGEAQPGHHGIAL